MRVDLYHTPIPYTVEMVGTISLTLEVRGLTGLSFGETIMNTELGILGFLLTIFYLRCCLHYPTREIPMTSLVLTVPFAIPYSAVVFISEDHRSR